MEIAHKKIIPRESIKVKHPVHIFEKKTMERGIGGDEKNCSHFVEFFRAILIDNGGIDMLSYKEIEMTAMSAVIRICNDIC